MKRKRKFVGNRRNARRVRMLVTFETINRLRELKKRLACCLVD
jgi:hypothetical protein